MRFRIYSKDRLHLGLAAVAQSFVDRQCTPPNMAPDKAARTALDAFKRAVLAELELLEVEVLEAGNKSAN